MYLIYIYICIFCDAIRNKWKFLRFYGAKLNSISLFFLLVFCHAPQCECVWMCVLICFLHGTQTEYMNILVSDGYIDRYCAKSKVYSKLKGDLPLKYLQKTRIRLECFFTLSQATNSFIFAIDGSRSSIVKFIACAS